MSSVNSSRSAYGAFVFEKPFFSRYELLQGEKGAESASLCVVAKAILSTLKPKSASSIESCTISLTSDDPSAPAATGVSCRLTVRLHCQHGVLKTHRLTYGASSALYAQARKETCTSRWTASSRILKDWTDHFHMRSSVQGGGTEEISFRHGDGKVNLCSFSSSAISDDPLGSKPMSTELQVDADDFDKYAVEGEPIITFALKEFKAIITISESLQLPLKAAFTKGSEPILIDFRHDLFRGDFVIATNDYDGSDGIKQEKEAGSRKGSEQPKRNATASASANGNGNGRGSGRNASAGPSRSTTNGNAEAGPSKPAPKKPLFNPPSQGADEEDEDEEDDAFFNEMGDADWEAIDRLSQVPAKRPGVELVPESSAQTKPLVPESTPFGEREDDEGGGEEDEEYESTARMSLMSQAGPPTKKPRWALFEDD